MHNISNIAHRSILFVPAIRPEIFDKAVATGADAICIDLEDGVQPEQKDQARKLALPFFTQPRKSEEQRILRINSLGSIDGLKDILLLAESKVMPDSIILPKVNSAAEILLLGSLLGSNCQNLNLIALIESVQGLENAINIAQAPYLRAIVFGSADYSAELGCSMGWEALHNGRSKILHAASLAGIEPLDGGWLDLDDITGLSEDCKSLASMGFVGRIALHPKQVSTIQSAFTPSADEVLRAQKIISAFEDHQGGVFALDGKMIDLPVVNAARRLLRFAK